MRHLQRELYASEDCRGAFDAIPAELLAHHYEADRTGLHLLAGERRRSDCCDAAAWLCLEGHGVTALRCDRCFQLCAIDWGAADDDWAVGDGKTYRPRYQKHDEWIVRHAVQINRQCGFLVLRSDRLGTVLQQPGGPRQPDPIVSHWLPLYRLRGAPWRRKAR